MSYTPGPWEVDDSLFKIGYFFKIKSSKGLVAEISQCDDKDEELANANLIAAAPDLLEACEAFVEAWEKSLQLEKTDVALGMAKAAIERARGGT